MFWDIVENGFQFVSDPGEAGTLCYILERDVVILLVHNAFRGSRNVSGLKMMSWWPIINLRISRTRRTLRSRCVPGPTLSQSREV